MRSGNPRTLRVGEQIRRELSRLLQYEVKDPRVCGVTINDVEVSGDFAHARVFYTLFGDQAPGAREASQQGLERAAGFLRARLGREIRIRQIPNLHFIYDNTMEEAERLDTLIEAARRRDSDTGEPDS